MKIRVAGVGPVTIEELEARFQAYLSAGAPEPMLEGTPDERASVYQLVAQRGDSQMKSLMAQYLKPERP